MIATLALCAVAFCLGGIRGRIQGGWLGISNRGIIFGTSGLLNCGWMLYLGASIYVAAPAAIAIEAFWAPGHNWTNFGALMKRYGPFGLFWWYAQKWVPADFRFNIKWLPGEEVDGPIAVAEFLARATMYGIVVPLAVQLDWVGIWRWLGILIKSV